jgi:hypothetical protein
VALEERDEPLRGESTAVADGYHDASGVAIVSGIDRARNRWLSLFYPFKNKYDVHARVFQQPRCPSLLGNYDFRSHTIELTYVLLRIVVAVRAWSVF